MEAALRGCCLGVKIGKILITRPTGGADRLIRLFLTAFECSVGRQFCSLYTLESFTLTSAPVYLRERGRVLVQRGDRCSRLAC